MTERELQVAVVELASYLGWLTYHTFDSRRSAAGFPDLVMVRAPRIVFAELKSSVGRLSSDQVAWNVELEAVAKALCGGEPIRSIGVEIWRPADWASGAVEAALR